MEWGVQWPLQGRSLEQVVIAANWQAIDAPSFERYLLSSLASICSSSDSQAWSEAAHRVQGLLADNSTG